MLLIYLNIIVILTLYPDIKNCLKTNDDTDVHKLLALPKKNGIIDSVL